MTTEKENFIVWDNHGVECQRLRLALLYGLARQTYRQNDIYTDYSFHHMSKYSFGSDLMFVLTNYNNFVVVPKVKISTFQAKLPGRHYYDLSSAHIMNNDSSKVWLLGGTKVGVDINRITGIMDRNVYLDYETRILDLM